MSSIPRHCRKGRQKGRRRLYRRSRGKSCHRHPPRSLFLLPCFFRSSGSESSVPADRGDFSFAPEKFSSKKFSWSPMKKILCLAFSLFWDSFFAFRPPTAWKTVSLSLSHGLEQFGTASPATSVKISSSPPRRSRHQRHEGRRLRIRCHRRLLASQPRRRRDIVVDPKNFPNGIKPSPITSIPKGLKFGIYSDAGTKTCAGRPGGRATEYQDALQ